jgi:hypothetical protein
MKASSKKSPCPVCGRYTDDKCRSNDESILCYSGDKFGPSANLRKGDSIQALGKTWILISYNAGFSATSYLFVIDDGRYKKLSPQEKSQLNRKKVALARKAILAFRGIEDNFFLLLAPRDLFSLAPDEIDYVEAFGNKLIELCENLEDFLSLNRIHIKQLGAIRGRLHQMRELLKGVQGDLGHFRRQFLGEPVQAHSRGTEGAQTQSSS